MVIRALAAMGVTYINNSKLFWTSPAGRIRNGNGCGFSFTFSLHAKGKIGRYTHIVLNATLLALFSWQALSGVQIIKISSVSSPEVGYSTPYSKTLRLNLKPVDLKICENLPAL